MFIYNQLVRGHPRLSALVVRHIRSCRRLAMGPPRADKGRCYMLAFGWWDVFGWIGLAAIALFVICLVLAGIGGIAFFVRKEGEKKLKELLVAISVAEELPLSEAVTTLREAGISYGSSDGEGLSWSLPEEFWGPERPTAKAKALVAVLRDAQNRKDIEVESCSFDLVRVILGELRKRPHTVLFIVMEIARVSDYIGVLELALANIRTGEKK